MNILALVGLVLFALYAALSFYSAGHAKAGSLPFGSPLGLRGREVLASAKAWKVGHEAAAFFVFLGGLVAVVHMVGCAFVALTSTSSTDPLGQVLVVAGLIACAGVRLVASSLANRTAKEVNTDDVAS